MKPTIGTIEGVGQLVLDVPHLIDTRLLVQSNSGGGKSWVLRRLLEQTADKVQQIVLDTEGEFATLREHYDYVLCAPHGADAVATPQTATLLAHRLRESRVSAIIDLYDLKMHDRRRFVRLFLEELIDAPKANWHPALVVVDEVHLYCPEKGEAESLQAVIDLASRGRKRGLCACLATQRLSKLHKDAAAELLNKLIGRTGLDVDVKRAADELGMTAKEAMPLLRNLDPGEFYTFGPALSKVITKIKVGSVKSRHPKAGEREIGPPPAPSERIKKVLADLGDLPKEAEQEARTMADMKREVANLKRELTLAKKEQPRQPATEIKTIEKPVVGMKAIKGILQSDANIRKTLGKMRMVQEAIQAGLTGYQQSIEKLLIEFRKVQDAQDAKIMQPGQIYIPAPIKTVPIQRTVNPVSTSSNGANAIFGKGERRILTAVAQHNDGVTRKQITVLTGYKRSSRDTFLQRLRQAEVVEFRDNRIFATDTGIVLLGNDYIPLPTGPELRYYWLQHLPSGERKLLEVLISAYPDAVGRQQLEDATGYKRSSRDTFLQKLRSRELIEVFGSEVRASERLF